MFTIRNARPDEYDQIGRMLVDVYSALNDFPKPAEQPEYYKMLLNVGLLTAKPGTEILVALNDLAQIAATVVYFSDMSNYGSGGTATQEPNAAGFRLLAVGNQSRGLGVGKLLTLECIRKARAAGKKTLVIHTTSAMMRAWKMYSMLGFSRSPDLDFIQGKMPVFGFRYNVREVIL